MADEPRFLRPSDVADVLNISSSQVYALVRSGELPAIKVGGRGQWRVERDKLESYIARMYEQTRDFITEHPFADVETDAETGAESETDAGPGVRGALRD